MSRSRSTASGALALAGAVSLLPISLSTCNGTGETGTSDPLRGFLSRSSSLASKVPVWSYCSGNSQNDEVSLARAVSPCSQHSIWQNQNPTPSHKFVVDWLWGLWHRGPSFCEVGPANCEGMQLDHNTTSYMVCSSIQSSGPQFVEWCETAEVPHSKARCQRYQHNRHERSSVLRLCMQCHAYVAI